MIEFEQGGNELIEYIRSLYKDKETGFLSQLMERDLHVILHNPSKDAFLNMVLALSSGMLSENRNDWQELYGTFHGVCGLALKNKELFGVLYMAYFIAFRTGKHSYALLDNIQAKEALVECYVLNMDDGFSDVVSLFNKSGTKNKSQSKSKKKRRSVE